MKTFLLPILGLVLFASCSRKTNLVPISDNTYFVEQRLIAEASNASVNLNMNFDRATRNFYIYELELSNLNKKSLMLAPSDFYYQLDDSGTKYLGMPLEEVISIIDRQIVQLKRSKEVDGWLEVFDVVTDIILETDDPDSDADYYESQESTSERIIRLYELKEYLAQYYLKSGELIKGESAYGILYFPRNRKEQGKIHHVNYNGVGSLIQIPFSKR